jgi:hypothetical protein
MRITYSMVMNSYGIGLLRFWTNFSLGLSLAYYKNDNFHSLIFGFYTLQMKAK